MSRSSERLYGMLPSVHRARDTAEGEPLHALLNVLEEEMRVVEADIGNLYDNWFIETCDEWVVPYIGDLLGVRGLRELGTSTMTQRAQVANTIRYRRRKGTAYVLEQMARDVTNWPAKVVEYYQLLSMTQHLNHLMPQHHRTIDVRDAISMEHLGGPFEDVAHLVEVRKIASGGRRYNIQNIGLYAWRLQEYHVDESSARPVADGTDGRFTFDPAGLDVSLFNVPEKAGEITQLAKEINLPGILSRRILNSKIEAYREATKNLDKPEDKDVLRRAIPYIGDNPVFDVVKDGVSVLMNPEKLFFCDLSGWRCETCGDKQCENSEVVVDPTLGRLLFPARNGVARPASIQVSYNYGFSGDVGAGTYSRQDYLAKILDRKVSWQAGVSKQHASPSEPIYSTLTEALAEWSALPEDSVGVIAIMDNQSYDADDSIDRAFNVEVKRGSKLVIIAADWLTESNKAEPLLKGRLVPNGLRPHLLGDFNMRVAGVDEKHVAGELTLDGLLVEGKLTVSADSRGDLRLSHCTLVPNRGGLTSAVGMNELNVEMYRSICGPITLPETVTRLDIVDSIVDGVGEPAIIAKGTSARLQSCTVIGSTNVSSLEAGNCIFTDSVDVHRRQVGCVRYSYLPPGSTKPRSYRCQPELETGGRSSLAGETGIWTRVKPCFASLRYGDHSYARLDENCVKEIMNGAEDGSEMGVFNFLKQPQREASLHLRLEEYLPFGLEAGTFDAT